MKWKTLPVFYQSFPYRQRNTKVNFPALQLWLCGRLMIANLAKWKDFYSSAQFLVPRIPKSAKGLIYDFHRAMEYNKSPVRKGKANNAFGEIYSDCDDLAGHSVI